MSIPKHVNIGSPERPVQILETALIPDSIEGREWWENVANGSIVVDKQILDVLLERTQKTSDQEGV